MIGALNQRATIAARSESGDGGGGFEEGWTDIANVWVKVEARSGSETFGPGRTESAASLRVTLRRNTEIAAGQRLTIGARPLTIRAVLDDGPQNPFMTLICEESP